MSKSFEKIAKECLVSVKSISEGINTSPDKEFTKLVKSANSSIKVLFKKVKSKRIKPTIHLTQQSAIYIAECIALNDIITEKKELKNFDYDEFNLLLQNLAELPTILFILFQRNPRAFINIHEADISGTARVYLFTDAACGVDHLAPGSEWISEFTTNFNRELLEYCTKVLSWKPKNKEIKILISAADRIVNKMSFSRHLLFINYVDDVEPKGVRSRVKSILNRFGASPLKKREFTHIPGV